MLSLLLGGRKKMAAGLRRGRPSALAEDDVVEFVR
jgi:hypothetical protein